MAFKPSLRSIWTLVLLAVMCMALYAWCETSRVQKKMSHYDEKMAAAKLMERALEALLSGRTDTLVAVDAYKTDPRVSVILGQQFSSITTDLGIFESKLVGANPNFAGLAVELLTQAGLKRGDQIAIGMTGSHPGVNIAVLCACEALGIKANTIASVGSSWWGANDPDFTWVDMEKLLNDKGLVHSNRLAASLGGSEDVAMGLSTDGQELLRRAISRNGLKMIFEQNIPASAARRWQIYKDGLQGTAYKAYVNIGGGVASLGHSENAALIPNGFLRALPSKNYPGRGVVHLFNESGASIINFHDIEWLSRHYGLGGPRVPLPEAGRGEVYVSERYDVRVAAIAATLAMLVLLILVRIDAKLFRLREAGVDPDTLM